MGAGVGARDGEGGPVTRRYAVVPTRDRPGDFRDCVAALAPQVDMVAVVAHHPGLTDEVAQQYVWEACEEHWPKVAVLPYREDPPNISRMWNHGLDYCSNAAVYSDWEHQRDEFWVAVLNDDAVVPPGWLDRVVSAMEASGAAAGSHRQPGMAAGKMAGHAFVLRGSTRLRADVQFQWWYGDDDLQRRAGEAGGVALVPGLEVEHRHPNGTTVGELARVAGEDMLRYERKWPW